MITQELLNFIKEELQAGMTKEQISNLLQAHGWHPSDIEEGFVHFMPATSAPVAKAAVLPAAEPLMAASSVTEITHPVSQPVAEPLTRPIQSQIQPQPQVQPQPIQPVQQPQQPQVKIETQQVRFEAQPYVKPQPMQPAQPQAQYQAPVQTQFRPQPQPMMQPAAAAAAAPMQPNPLAQPAQNTFAMMKHSFRNPSFIVGLLALVVGSLIGAVLLSVNPRAMILPFTGTALIGWGFVALFILTFIGAVILNMITRVFEIEGHSLAKANLFQGMKTVITFALLALMAVGVPWIIVFILAVVILFALFCFYYQVSLLRAIYVFIFGLGFDVLISIIIGLIVAAFGFSALKLLPLTSEVGARSMAMAQANSFNQLPSNVNTNGAWQVNLAPSTSTVNPSDVLVAEQAFPAGIAFPDDSQIVSLKETTVPGTTVPVTDITYTQTDTVSNIAADYSAALKKDGYTVPVSPVASPSLQTIAATKLLSNHSLISADFSIGQQNGTTQVVATITQ